MPRSLPTSAIRRSASRSAATAGGTPSASAVARICLVVPRICSALALRPLEAEAVQLVSHLDDAARVHQVIGRVDDAVVGQHLLDARVGQLVVRPAADDLGAGSPECGHGVVVDGTAEGARRVDIELSCAAARPGSPRRSPPGAAPARARWRHGWCRRSRRARRRRSGDQPAGGRPCRRPRRPLSCRPGWCCPRHARRPPASPGIRRRRSAPRSRLPRRWAPSVR